MLFRSRDLRISDHPALNAAIEAGDEIVPVFILDKTQIAEAGHKLLAYMGQSLRSLDESLGNCLHIIEGDQVEVLSELIEMYGVSEAALIISWLLFFSFKFLLFNLADNFIFSFTRSLNSLVLP